MKQKKSSQTNIKRLKVLKTYKIFIGSNFPRSESGRYDIFCDTDGKPIANTSRSSRKDFRDAVISARESLKGWSGKSAYNRGQILYRMAEMLESRRSQFVEEICIQGETYQKAEKEVSQSIDRLVYYSGWADKYQQIFGSVNTVASSHFNFSIAEYMGVISIIAPENIALLGLVSVIAPVIAGGNTCVVLASGTKPLSAITFAEVIHSSDVPGGVINILTGRRKELIGPFSSHMDVNAVMYCGDSTEEKKIIQINAALNVKRVIIPKFNDWSKENCEDPYLIMNTQEIKTTWHPVGI